MAGENALARFPSQEQRPYIDARPYRNRRADS